MRRIYLLAISLMALSLYTPVALARDLVTEALSGFPPGTVRLEFSSPSKLRRLPNYQNLRQRFVGPRLQALETSLSKIGIREEDIDELMLGWQPGTGMADFYGFASGRFDPKAVAASAAEQGLAPTDVGGQQAYCLGESASGTCVIALEYSLGAFGTTNLLTSIVEARSGQGKSLNSDDRFARLVGDVRKDTPIWGVAVGPAVGDWFRGWMPSQGNIKLDWSRVFENVDSLSYTVDASDKVNLDMQLNCKTEQAATSLRQILEGLKLAQQLAWQNQNPNRPNPFEAMDLGVSGRQISLKLTTDYSQLELAGGFGAPQN
jgi:hypothetical protein